MHPDDVQATIDEAERFLKLAKEFEWEWIEGTGPSKGKKWKSPAAYSKKNAAIKRASLDLTSALAAMRRGTRWEIISKKYEETA